MEAAKKVFFRLFRPAALRFALLAMTEEENCRAT
jgi:hypothetical protein